jgi:hypothetical protein
LYVNDSKKGLQQGDPLLPYVFVIVAGVLQRLIQQASRDVTLDHPIDPALPCHVLQYADDTMILTISPKEMGILSQPSKRTFTIYVWQQACQSTTTN